ncbi:MAG TPA: sialidase family protein [Vicinamibacterales bacterium]|nr:sialidase family protein [Vicinamibacterales bacterium]
MHKRFALAIVVCLAFVGLFVGLHANDRQDQPSSERAAKAPAGRMSAAGSAARRRVKGVAAALEATGLARVEDLTGSKAPGKAQCSEADEDDCGEAEGLSEGPPSTQSEVSIAVDRTGQHIVIGFNDFRGFDNGSNPLSISGFMYSDDGGATFVDGGQLPSPGTDLIGTQRFPEVFGDPDVRYLGACTFIYSSIVVKKFSPSTAAQTMGIHRSTDCGHTWTGPFEVTAATNPNGLSVPDPAGNPIPVDAADKEFMSVDPDTGRVIMSWSNFTDPARVPSAPGGVEISTTYSDNVMTATPPTWSTRRVVGHDRQDGQSSIPAFAGRGSSNVYVAWSRFPAFGFIHKVAFARSADNGATWSSPIELSGIFAATDQILGNDRVNTSPSLAVDTSAGPHRGNVYVVYGNNNRFDGADVVFQRSLDGGVTFSTPIYLNSRPGDDRAQWFPWVAVDANTGRVNVFYYDQDVDASGDVSQVSWQFSNDGGLSWSKPMALTARSFHAGHGNDTGQPNLGDYNQAVARQNQLFAAFASTHQVGFADGQPGVRFTVPDVTFIRNPPQRISLRQGLITVTDGRADHRRHTDNGDGDNQGEDDDDQGGVVKLVNIPLFNYVTNPLNASPVRHVVGRLTTTTPGVEIEQDEAEYRTIAPGETRAQDEDYALQLSSSFVAGTPIELVLHVKSEEGTTVLLDTIETGQPQATQLLAENFNGVPPGTLPAGWTPVHVTRTNGTPNNVPWTTSSTFCGTTSNAAFHVNANDVVAPPAPNQARFERLFSPPFDVPAASSYVTLDMDVCTNTEDEPFFNIQAYDGLVLRIADLTTGRVLRSNLAEAFAMQITTGSLKHYPKHFPRFTSAVYLEDMSAWAGDSHGFQHVHMKLPGMNGSRAQLRFEFTQDSLFDCTAVRPGTACGVMVDNIVIKNVVLGGRP